jgi:hypothetical protein
MPSGKIVEIDNFNLPAGRFFIIRNYGKDNNKVS